MTKGNRTMTNDRKLKLFAPIWKDPLGWGRWMGNSKLHVFFWSLFHIAFMSPFIIYGSLAQQLPLKSAFIIFPLLFGGFYPCLYIYVIYRLIKKIDESQTEES